MEDRWSFLEHSTLFSILSDNPALSRFETKSVELVRYKGRLYCWVTFHHGLLILPDKTMETFGVRQKNGQPPRVSV
jgi:hypothetical protein